MATIQVADSKGSLEAVEGLRKFYGIPLSKSA